MPTPDALEAYAVWHAAKRALDDTLPWTPDWLRLRLIEQELRSEWERLVTDDAQVGSDGVTRDGQEAGSRASG